MLRRVPHLVNPTAEMVAEYAAANGYKELITAPRPGRFYAPHYVEDGEHIRKEWEAEDLEAAKEVALAEVQRLRDSKMNGVVIECDGLPNGIKFDTEAMSYATGLVALLASGGSLTEEDTWTDAADETHALTPELLGSIVPAMKSHVTDVQKFFKTPRDTIRGATDVDEVEAAIPEPNAFENRKNQQI